MRYRQIPNTSLEPSVIALGTAGLGTRVQGDDAFRLLDYYVELGGNFIDTARVYGDWASDEPAVSEKTIGRWLKQSGLREQVIIGTKGCHPVVGTSTPRVTPECLRVDLYGSLESLQVDSIDLYWLHRDDPGLPVGPILEALEGFRKQGLIRHYGCSNWSCTRIKEAAEYARRHGLEGFVANQMLWSYATLNAGALSDPTLVPMDQETWNYHKETQLAAVPYSSQAKGFFAGKYGRNVTDPQTRSAKQVMALYYNEENFSRLRLAKLIGEKLGSTANDVALAYLLHQPFPVFPIVGCHTPEQLAAACRAADLALPADYLQWLQV